MFLVKLTGFMQKENTSETDENIADNDLTLFEDRDTRNQAVKTDGHFLQDERKVPNKKRWKLVRKLPDGFALSLELKV